MLLKCKNSLRTYPPKTKPAPLGDILKPGVSSSSGSDHIISVNAPSWGIS